MVTLKIHSTDKHRENKLIGSSLISQEPTGETGSKHHAVVCWEQHKRANIQNPDLGKETGGSSY